MAKKEFNEGENGLKTKEEQTFNNADESFSMGFGNLVKPISHRIGPMMNSCM